MSNNRLCNLMLILSCVTGCTLEDVREDGAQCPDPINDPNEAVRKSSTDQF